MGLSVDDWTVEKTMVLVKWFQGDRAQIMGWALARDVGAELPTWEKLSQAIRESTTAPERMESLEKIGLELSRRMRDDLLGGGGDWDSITIRAIDDRGIPTVEIIMGCVSGRASFDAAVESSRLMRRGVDASGEWARGNPIPDMSKEWQRLMASRLARELEMAASQGEELSERGRL